MNSTNIDLVIAAFLIVNIVLLAASLRLGRAQAPLSIEDMMPPALDTEAEKTAGD